MKKGKLKAVFLVSLLLTFCIVGGIFLTMQKTKSKNTALELQNFDFEDPALKVWLAHQDNQYKTQSRFSNLFKEIMDNDRKMSQEGQKSTENKDISEDKINNNNYDKKKEDEKKI